MAFEGLLRAWSSERTLYRDALHCVVDKPAGVACGSAPSPAADSFASLEQRLAEFGLGSLTTLSATPRRASGVTLLRFGGASAGAAPGHLPDVLSGLHAVVALEGCRLAPSGQLELGDGDSNRRLKYKVGRRSGSRALVEVKGDATPELVARTLARHGHPIVGDTAPGAPAATRLMLHVNRVFGRLNAQASLPAEFDSWLAGAALLPASQFASALTTAGVARFELGRSLEAFRLIGEEAGEIAGVTVDRYGEYAVLAVSSEEAWLQREQIASCLMDHGARGVYVKRRVRADLRGTDPALLAPPLPLCGSPAPESLRVQQGPCAFWVKLSDGLATGLFLDQRANWDRVFEAARGASLLNLFSYTGAFTLAAIAGGAAATVSVDLAGRALSRLAENLELNALSGPEHRLLKDDVPSFVARAQRAERRFDWVVLDPPSFGTRARGVLSTQRDNAGLVAGALALLAPRGRLLCVSHHRKITDRELATQVARTCEQAGRRAKVEALVGGWDCPTVPGVSGTKSVLAKLV